MTVEIGLDRHCIACAELIEADDLFCLACGAKQMLVCLHCSAEYPAGDKFCINDGSILSAQTRPISPAPAPGSNWQAGFAIHASRAQQSLGPFWQRHKALIVITVILLAGSIAATEATGGMAPAAMAIALLAGWAVALSRSEKSLAFVDRVDGWTDKVEFYASHGGKVRRFIVFPIAWLTNMLALQTNRIPDPWSAAAVRLIAYSLATALVLVLLFWITMFIIALFIIGVSLWILAAVMGDGPDFGGKATDKIVQTASRRMRGKVIRGKDGWIGQGDMVGRVGDDGQIYGPDGWFGKGEQVGRVGDDGQIYGPDGWFGKGEQTGRVDDDGQVRGPDGWFGKGEQTGRVDDDGQIRGPDGWFGKGEQKGRFTDD
jgi:hypothetical protein